MNRVHAGDVATHHLRKAARLTSKNQAPSRKDSDHRASEDLLRDRAHGRKPAPRAQMAQLLGSRSEGRMCADSKAGSMMGTHGCWHG